MQRRHIRVNCGCPARAHLPKGDVRGICQTLSEGGMFFVGPILPVGQSIWLTLLLPEGEVRALGTVGYHHAYREGAGMGILFRKIRRGTKVLRDFIDRSDRPAKLTPSWSMVQAPALQAIRNDTRDGEDR